MNTFESVRLSEIREVWESFSGWYWFVTEYHDGSLAFGLVKGWEIEWGYFDLNELRKLATQSKVWPVPKKNWVLCPCVIEDAASYSKNPGFGKGCKSFYSLGLSVRPTIKRRYFKHGKRKQKH